MAVQSRRETLEGLSLCRIRNNSLLWFMFKQPELRLYETSQMLQWPALWMLGHCHSVLLQRWSSKQPWGLAGGVTDSPCVYYSAVLLGVRFISALFNHSYTPWHANRATTKWIGQKVKIKGDRWWGAGDNRGPSLEAGTHNLQPSAEDAAVTLQDIRSCCKRRMTTAWKQQRSLHVLFFPDISKKMGSTWGFEPFVIFIVSVLINDHPL